MKKGIRRALSVLMLAIFLYSGGKLLFIRHRYRTSEKVYRDAATAFTRPSATNAPGAAPAPATAPSPAAAADSGSHGAAQDREPDADTPLLAPQLAPIQVDFDALTKANSEIVGWLYCEDSVINYPVVWGRDNNFYLGRDYLGNPDPSGTIFINAANQRNFSDANVIMYGHNMQNMTMFASLRYWLDQAYYEEHPVMWLLTPRQDYRIELFAAYTTPADSDTYTIIPAQGEELSGYLQRVCARSKIYAPFELNENAKYVVLSTCAYDYELARNVLHGMLVPLDSAGGVPKHSPA